MVKITKNRRRIFAGLAAAMIMLISSCGQAAFDVTVYPSDVTGIDLSALVGSDYIIKVETYVETGDMGIDLDKLVYNYTLVNHSSDKNLKIEVRLSLYGEATLDDNNKITVMQDSDGDGYADAVIVPTGGTVPVWLTAPYKDTVSAEGYGWVDLIGSPLSPVSLAGGSTVTDTTALSGNPVIDRILKQDGIWVDVYIIPDFSFPATFSSDDLMDVINQSIRAVGSKNTGYFPGAFGTL